MLSFVLVVIVVVIVVVAQHDDLYTLSPGSWSNVGRALASECADPCQKITDSVAGGASWVQIWLESF